MTSPGITLPERAGITILIVDDDPDVLEATVSIVRSAGYATVAGGTAAEALSLAATHRPALVLLDVVLPDGDGVEVARRLKDDPALAGVFVALLSGERIAPEEQARGLREGLADGYMARPLARAEFMARIETFLRIRDAQERLRESEERYRLLSVSLESRVEERTLGLSQAVEELERALNAKDAFLANMSHELRTPLNSIIGFSAMLESGMAGELPPEARRQAGFVHRSGQELLGVVDALLAAASIADGSVRLDMAPCSIDDVLRAVEATMGPQARAAHLALSIGPPAVPLTIVSDGARIQEILFTLIGNAIKFTDAGSVSLDVSVCDARVRFAVADTGVGIAPEDLASIMEPFHQLPRPGVAKTQGVGLGLSTASRMAVALGGKIDVESEPGVGSTFTLVLPLRGPDAGDVAPDLG